MMIKRKKPPVCEKCGKEVARSFSYFQEETGEYKWQLCGSCTNDTERYYVRFDDFFESDESKVFWLRHLSEKTWMDWDAFWKMYNRYDYECLDIKIGDQSRKDPGSSQAVGLFDILLTR